MKITIRLAALVLLHASCAMLLKGCAAPATIAAAGVTAGFGLAQGQAESFIRGELKAARPVAPQQARLAVLEAMRSLELEVLSYRVGEADGYVRGKADGGREIKVSLKHDSPIITRFSIRVGIMGDVAVSQLVMSKIDAALGTPGAVDLSSHAAHEPSASAPATSPASD